MNLYDHEYVTHYNQVLTLCHVRRCWTECLEMADYRRRQKEVEKFNKEHRWRKRGITLVPTKFGIAFTALFLNQAGALIHIYGK